MNILVIGNGFDLAHRLPTKYGDFLEFVKVIGQIKNGKLLKDIDWGTINLKIKEQITDKEMDEKVNPFFGYKQCMDLMNNNIWIDYFLQCNMYQKENWIDFENEISNVIQSIDRDILSNNHKLEDEIKELSNSFFNSKYGGCQKSYRELREVLYNDLNKLIRTLELYLCAFVSRINDVKISRDIKDINFNKILSFNYTDTYKKFYDPKEIAKYDYIHIHGKAERAHSIETNNMVLGIDEYLPAERKDKDVDFIAFKKFYQRIFKGTGCEYKEWVDEIRESGKKIEEELRKEYSKQIPFEKFEYKHYLYIFGHSLDITDKDILRDLILNDNVYTTIFYFNKKDLGAKIANLVKVIGQDELIRRTGGSTKTIEFKLQQDMVERA